MKKSNQDAVIEGIAQSALDCIEAVATDAENARATHKRGDARVLTTMNTFNNLQAVKSIGDVSDTEVEALATLIKQPVIARVHFLDENDEEDVIFITRTTPRTVPGYKIASYRTEWGKIASLACPSSNNLGPGMLSWSGGSGSYCSSLGRLSSVEQATLADGV
ncbi:hypothetical protein, partial [Salipiger bermudensis]|uniref:hypothetical protein n=1 Tax=Salipiger bermudensis TaxID=344736 RepID=UPI001CD3FBD6